MRTWLTAFVVWMGLSLVAFAQPTPPTSPQQPAQPAQPTQPAQGQPAMSADATYKDIKATFGMMPTFFKAFPEEGIAAAWAEMRAIQLDPSTSLPPRLKELIGLAVAAQIPCRYCAYFHTQVAKANGATDRDIKEAIAIAAGTRHWSTVLYGAQIDEAAFKSEVGKMMAYAKKQMADKAPLPDLALVVDGPTAMKDMEKVVGMVPSFVRALPPAAIAPAWRLMRTVEFNPDTSIALKDKDLISLAVAAQVPCKYCIYMSTESAKAHGASDAELREAVAMAAVTRLWSTVLNGSLIDEPQFRTEVDQIMKNMKRSQKAARK